MICDIDYFREISLCLQATTLVDTLFSYLGNTRFLALSIHLYDEFFPQTHTYGVFENGKKPPIPNGHLVIHNIKWIKSWPELVLPLSQQAMPEYCTRLHSHMDESIKKNSMTQKVILSTTLSQVFYIVLQECRIFAFQWVEWPGTTYT